MRNRFVVCHSSLRVSAKAIPISAIGLALFALAALSLGAAAKPDHAEVLVGEVTIQEFSDTEIGVVLNRFDAEEADNTAEDVFILQIEGAPTFGIPIELAAARVIAKEDRLFVISLGDPRAIALFLSRVDRDEVEHSLRANLAALRGEGSGGEILLQAGHGLSHAWGEFHLPIESWPPARPGGDIFRKDFSDESTICIGGGPGSTSCGVDCLAGGCSVTCQTGFYACCGCRWTPSCTCEKDGGSNECPPFPCVK